MFDYLAHARMLGAYLLPLAAVFAALALAVKGGAVVEAVRSVRREAATNAGLYFVNYLLLAPAFLLAAAALAGVISPPAFASGMWKAIPQPLTLLAAMILIDVMAYWRHRAGHLPELWRYHATHHADEALHWFSVTRKHPVDKAMELLADTLPALLLGVPLWAVAGAQVLRSWWGFFIHADLPWTLGPLKRLLISPAAHRLHHARDEAIMGTNYANTFAFVDIAFGTFADPTPHVGCATGIAEGTRGVFGELLRPWERRYRLATRHPSAEHPIAS